MGELSVVSDMVGCCVGTSSSVPSSWTRTRVGMVKMVICCLPEMLLLLRLFPQLEPSCGNSEECSVLAILVMRSWPGSVELRVIIKVVS